MSPKLLNEEVTVTLMEYRNASLLMKVKMLHAAVHERMVRKQEFNKEMEKIDYAIVEMTGLLLCIPKLEEEE